MPSPDREVRYRTLSYEVTGRVARITFERPEAGNAITADTPVELAHAVERADIDPGVHVILVSGRGTGFCGGYDLSMFAEHGPDFGAGEHAVGVEPTDQPRAGTMLDPTAQGRNHDPARTWDPMLDYAMMSRFNRGFASLLHATKPTVAKLHGFCIAGGTDIALFADQIVAASDTKIGYPPTRGCGASSWPRVCGRTGVGDQRAKRLLFTGDLPRSPAAEAYEWGLAVEAPDTGGSRRAHRDTARAHRQDAAQPVDDGQARAQLRLARSRGGQ